VRSSRLLQGRERLEPVGILIFSSVMGTASLMLIIEAIRKLAENPDEPPDTGALSGNPLVDLVRPC